MKVKNRKTGNTFDLKENIVDSLLSKGVSIVKLEKKEIKTPKVLKAKED